jgi:hypothetical protein
MSSPRHLPGASDTLVLRFLWVPHGEEPDPAELAKFQDPIRVPARFVRRHRPEAEPMDAAPATAHDHRPPTGPFAPIGRHGRHGVRSGAHRGLTPGEVVLRQNVHDLATVIYAEAGGRPLAEQVAVGFTLRNRMLRNHAATVREAWGGFAHHSPEARDMARFEQLARDILEGRVNDPTGGATHFYSPHLMPRAGQPTGHRDVRGGLEPTPDHFDQQTGEPILTYRPGWALTFEPVPLPGIDPWQFRFYRQQGSGHVR